MSHAPLATRDAGEVNSAASGTLRRVERWRWLVALGAAGVLVVFDLSFLIGVWLGGLLIVGFHEAGHAVTARRVGVPTSAMVIGVGPMILRLAWGGLRIEVRALPVVGWVELERADLPDGSLRMTAVYAAGPLASLLLSVLILLAGFAWFQGPTEVGITDARYSVRTTVETARSMWAAPFAPVTHLVGSKPDGEDRGGRRGATSHGQSSDSSAGEHAREQDAVTVVGMAAAAPASVAEYGLGWVFAALAGTSASVAGLNLLPAWGLDGHGMLGEVAGIIERRRPRWRRGARRAVAIVSVVTAVFGIWLVCGALLRDLVRLL